MLHRLRFSIVVFILNYETCGIDFGCADSDLNTIVVQVNDAGCNLLTAAIGSMALYYPSNVLKYD